MRLIDADELMEKAGRYKFAVREDIYELVRRAPTIDPVKHGRWVRLTKDGYEPQEYMCSLCCRTIRYLGAPALLIERYPYCHCGAKMGGKDGA